MHTTEELQMALLGYQQQLNEVEGKITNLRRRLGSHSTEAPSVASTSAAPTAGEPRKHRISPEGRARIAAAQRRRWAAAKKE